MMVAPHPRLAERIKNTKALIRQGKRHIVPELADMMPQNYLGLWEFDRLEMIKPWVERRRESEPPDIRTAAPYPHKPIVVLCVDFEDKPAQVPTSEIYNKFFSATYNGGLTFRNYIAENSYGTYVPEGRVYGWYRAPQPYTYYTNSKSGLGPYPNNGQGLAEDTIRMAISDPAVDWTYIDSNGDLIIDYVFIIHAGNEGAVSGSPNDMWAHASQVIQRKFGNYWFLWFCSTSEYLNDPLSQQRCGIDAHEFYHIIQPAGLPDLYGSDSYGLGLFSLMSHGNWGNGAYTPTHLDAWSKYVMGYTTTLINTEGTVLLLRAEDRNYNLLYTTSNPVEHFIIENRQRVLFDQYLPGSGLAIYKINESQPGNGNELCYRVGLLQADGQRNLENSVNLGDSGDPYPGMANNRRFSPSTNPSTVLCDGTKANIIITGISDSSDAMLLSVSLCEEAKAQVQVI